MNEHHRRSLEQLFTEVIIKKGMSDEEAMQFLGNRCSYAKDSTGIHINGHPH